MFSFSSENLPGKDIYWYGVQAKSLINTGQLHSPDTSFVFHIVELIFRIFGESERSLFIFGFITYCFLTFCGFLTIRFSKTILSDKEAERGNFPFYIFLSGIWISFLYPKQAWGLGLFSIGISLYLRFLMDRKNIYRKFKYLILSLAFIGISGLAHSVFLILGMVFLFGFFLDKIIQKNSWKILNITLIAFVLVILFYIARIYLFNFTFGGRIDTERNFDIPLLDAYRIYGIAFVLEWVLIFLFLILERKSAFLIFILGALFLPWASFADLQFRILLSILWISELFLRGSRKAYFAGILICFIWFLSIKSDYSKFGHDYPGFRKVIAGFPEKFQPGLLIAHHGFCEFIKFYKEYDCLSWKPDDKAKNELPKNSEIYRIVKGFSYRELDSAFDLKGKKIFKAPIITLGNYLLVKEADWDDFHSIKEEERDEKSLSRIESWINPFKERPKFILKKYEGSK
ncbi:hypothetical protein [Leptospira neocaledonica]|uniref:hypothetical protein n=1 Tax=Leptospira neocaledonica TaxID=2023192 RepID=UPI000F6485AD|nr:hypothetical protein [Leptospira neocaledonica]